MKSISKKSSLLVGALLCAAGLSLAAQGAAPALPQPKPTPAAKTKVPTKPAVKPVDLNKATKAELMKLPTIDSALADKIIAGRPYLTKSNLVTNKIIPMTTYQVIRTRVFVMAKLPASKK
jgi:DNA uptake protein ComE-like DNA-binding protein